MIGENWPVIGELLGLGADEIAIWQMGVRAVIVYLAAIALVRLGEKRFLGRYTALDVILGFMLGSVLSSAITGSAPFFETILGGALSLVLIHWLFAVLSFRSERFGDLVKGTERVLVRDGKIDWESMQTSHISRSDLLAALRANGQLDEVEKVREARLERSGDISVLERESEPRVVEIEVKEGVQVVRLEIGA
jgi:uncharacterized membrane protein YcaP (DUF421 family)